MFLFEGLSVAEKEKIIKGFSHSKFFKKDEIIYSAEHFENAIGFIVKGCAFALCDNNSDVHIKTFESGSCFGAAAVFGGERYVSTVVAKTDIEVMFITEEQLKKIFLEYPVTSLNYIKFLSEKVRFLNKKMSLLSCQNAEDTVMKYLTSSADSEGYAQLPKSMTLLSKMLGLGRASLYRSLDTLERGGNIVRENNRIKVIKNEKNS
ncbi:MAG: Crp/Fnr family transcriptional regulator [Clostridia bacterium]|nr:Crp/Fnr family transcriptional regulator [Clostridia bacterium]